MTSETQISATETATAVPSTYQPKVGDQVILVVRYSAQPKLTTITKVTPSGRIKVADSNATFKGGSYLNIVFNAIGNHSSEVHKFNEAVLEGLTVRAEEQEARVAEKNAAQKQREEEYQQRIANELAEVKSVCADTLPIASLRTLPDGSRLVVLNAPINPKHDRKFEVVIVRLTDVEDTNWRDMSKVKMVESNATYTNGSGRSSSFPSCSSRKFSNDYDAMWDILRERFNDGW